MKSKEHERQFTYEEILFSLITPAALIPVTGDDIETKKRRSFSLVNRALSRLKLLFQSEGEEKKAKTLEVADEEDALSQVVKKQRVEKEQEVADDISWLEEYLPAVIHVAGTKGKGSTCMFCESILRSHGLNTVVYTSPHLISVNERIRINGQQISAEKLQYYVDRVITFLKQEECLTGLGFYKFITVLALYIVAAENKSASSSKIDVLILEVGLGGLLDATNVLSNKSKVVCGVTLLDYDHMDFLGNTIQEIAAQKAGIFLTGVPAYTISSQPLEAMEVLKETAEKVNTELTVTLPDEAKDVCAGDGGTACRLGIQGQHQFQNAALAIALCKEAIRAVNQRLGKQIKFSSEKAKVGLQGTTFAGRCQVLNDSQTSGVTFFLDGAHTTESMKATVKWLSQALAQSSEEGTDAQNVLVFNCAHTKPVRSILEAILNAELGFRKVYFVKPYSFKPSKKPLPTISEILEVPVKSKISQSSAEVKTSSWQETLKQVWEVMAQTRKASETDGDADQLIVTGLNIDDTITKIRTDASTAQHVRTNVFVTGSLLLVGDTLKSLKYTV